MEDARESLKDSGLFIPHGVIIRRYPVQSETCLETVNSSETLPWVATLEQVSLWWHLQFSLCPLRSWHFHISGLSFDGVSSCSLHRFFITLVQSMGFLFNNMLLINSSDFLCAYVVFSLNLPSFLSSLSIHTFFTYFWSFSPWFWLRSVSNTTLPSGWKHYPEIFNKILRLSSLNSASLKFLDQGKNTVRFSAKCNITSLALNQICIPPFRHELCPHCQHHS